MNHKLKLALAIAGTALVILGSTAALAFIVWSALAPAERAPLAAALLGRIDLLAFVALLITAGLGIVVKNLFDAYVVAPHRLAEETRLIARVNRGHRIAAGGTAELQGLACEINALADRCSELETGAATRAAESRAVLEEERNRFVALMSELAQSVLVCNIEGRVLLYNQRTLQLLNARFGAQSEHDAGVAFGLGRSLFGVMERDVVLHALENIQHRIQRNEARPVTTFVTTLAGGRLIRAQMAPVYAVGDAAVNQAAGLPPRISGFVLTLDDIGDRVESARRRDRLVQSLSEGNRASLANIRAAIESIVAFADMEPPQRRGLEQIIHAETQALSKRIDTTLLEYADCMRAEWPLETMLARDLLAAARRSIESRCGMRVDIEEADELIWIAVDSYAMVQALGYLAGRLRKECAVSAIRLRLQAAGRQVSLDLVWNGPPLAAEVVAQWQQAALDSGRAAAPQTFDDVVAQHNGEAWHQSDAAAGTAYFRLLLPLAEERGAPVELPAAPGRPAYYDFDLFHQPGQRPELDQCLLTELSYTVFDTETTGLEPAAGDEIISIGAVRIVNGRLLHGETFDQLIDPGRPLNPASTRIHGIKPELLAGQPRIARILPRFHRFCEDTVLVAHNAAFDMRFLQLKEASTGTRFSQPVLDTLMLSAVVHPRQQNHGLEAIAARLGVNIIGRHTALGDAIVTGEIFLRLLPLLAAQGIKTLQQARQASQQTAYARVQY